MKKLVLLFTVFFWACSSSPSGTINSDPEQLVLGNWKVYTAKIDGNNYPITTPGFGQIEAIFEQDLFTYIFPQVASNGIPTGNTDTLFAKWSFDSNFENLTFVDVETDLTVLVWQVNSLQTGRFSTSYSARSAESDTVVSKYEIDYKY